MKTSVHRSVLGLIILCTSAAPEVRAQGSAFSRIEIAGGGAWNVGDSRIFDYWQPGYGGELTFLTPFYLGSAEAGATYLRYDVISDAVPRFDAVFVFAGWGYALTPVKWVSWYNGFRVGNNRMTFDEETFPGVMNESEFVVGAQTRLTVRVFKQTGFFFAAHHTQTYTYVRIRATHLSAGLTTSFASPPWLQTFLR